METNQPLFQAIGIIRGSVTLALELGQTSTVTSKDGLSGINLTIELAMLSLKSSSARVFRNFYGIGIPDNLKASLKTSFAASLTVVLVAVSPKDCPHLTSLPKTVGSFSAFLAKS